MTAVRDLGDRRGAVLDWRRARAGRKGRLRAGYDADLVIVDGDPLTDIRALAAVSAVYLNGRAVAQMG